MYCVQCEQTMRTPVGNGCSYSQGMCGKTAETSDLQDLLVATLQSLSAWAIQARDLAIIDNEIDAFTAQAFFSTLTNVNFDSQRIVEYAQQAIAYRDNLMKEYAKQYPNYDFENNAGYGTKKHLEGLKEYGVTPIHRRDFEPIKSMLQGGKNE